MSIFSNLSADVDLILYSIKTHVYLTSSILVALILIHKVNTKLGGKLNILGIYPRHPFGLVGLLFAPFLHGDFNHLFFNAFPLFALMHMVLLTGVPAFLCITLIIMLIGGFLTWLVGRQCLHLGSSSVIMGYFGYMTAYSIFAPSFISVLAIIICLYYFGGLVISLIPSDKSVSWEGHIFGFIGGLAAFFLAPDVLVFLGL